MRGRSKCCVWCPRSPEKAIWQDHLSEKGSCSDKLDVTSVLASASLMAFCSSSAWLRGPGAAYWIQPGINHFQRMKWGKVKTGISEMAPPRQGTSCNQPEWPKRTKTEGKIEGRLKAHFFSVISIVVLLDLASTKLLFERGFCWSVQHFLPAQVSHEIPNISELKPSGRIIWRPGDQSPKERLRGISFIQTEKNIARLVVLQ